MEYWKLRGNREAPRWVIMICPALLCIGIFTLADHKFTMSIIAGILFIIAGSLGLVLGIRKRSVD
jgi:hypothetical protein